jgi:hypothetical protein
MNGDDPRGNTRRIIVGLFVVAAFVGDRSDVPPTIRLLHVQSFTVHRLPQPHLCAHFSGVQSFFALRISSIVKTRMIGLGYKMFYNLFIYSVLVCGFLSFSIHGKHCLDPSGPA